MKPYTLLIISRSKSLTRRLRSALLPSHYTIRWVPSTAEALRLRLRPSILLVQLPPSGGPRSVARLKARFSAPLLALYDADGRVPKPVNASVSRACDTETLVEMIQITLMSAAPDTIRAPGISLDAKTRRLQVGRRLYQLRPIACRIMAELIGRAGRVVPRDLLFHRVWNTEDDDHTRALDVHIAELRRLLEADPRRPTLIFTERGVGYRLEPPG
jgi:two-component system KDP operon response regulator KdpE